MNERSLNEKKIVNFGKVFTENLSNKVGSKHNVPMLAVDFRKTSVFMDFINGHYNYLVFIENILSVIESVFYFSGYDNNHFDKVVGVCVFVVVVGNVRIARRFIV